MRLLSWNVAQHRVSWDELAREGADVALLQEASPPPADCPIEVLPAVRDDWSTVGWRRRWRTAIARLSTNVELVERAATSIEAPDAGVVVSRLGSLTAADVVVDGVAEFTVVSMYAAWETPAGRDRPIFADASVHRLLSDLAALVPSPGGHAVIAAGDLNILHGYGEHGSAYWAARYATVFDRAEAMGLRFIGPQEPHGRQASPRPPELPEGSRDVPTYHTRTQGPMGATRQLDFVFASEPLAERITVHALNTNEAEWGPSDHCRIVIELES